MSKMKNPFEKMKNPRAILGAVLAAAVLLVCCVWYERKAGLLFAAMFLGAGFLKLKAKHPLVQFLMNGLWAVVCIFISGALPTLMVSEASYLGIGYYRIVMNFICVAVVYGICLAVTGNVKSAVASGSGLLMILATVNGFVWQFRGNLLKPMDILAVKTAMNVVGQYVFSIKRGMAYSWILWAWMVFCLGCLPPADALIPRKWMRPLAAVAAAACAVVFWKGTEDIKMNTWSNEGATRNGYYLNFAVGFRDFFVDAPEGYSDAAIGELEIRYPVDPGQPDPESMPNIIVIMNESFADCDILGSDLRTNEPVMPFVDSLQENTIRGYALTSVFGGTTANAEFEFLTGLSMANAPDGSCPYQQYIHEDIFSFVQLMNGYGYKTFSTHPYSANGWNRISVYPHLGFSESTFDEDYPHQDLVREFVSDRETYAYILNKLRQEREEPLFLFGITMQNHGDYIYEGPNYEQTIYLEGYEMEHPMAEQYLSLIHESDKAVEYLLTELEQYPEDTVVLFFGDHFPQVEGDFFLEVHGGEYATLSEQMLQYSIPFFIWANYDIPEETVECTSLNYLGRYLLEAAGMKLPPYYQFLADMEQAIPSMNADGYYSLSAGEYLPLEEAQGEEARWLREYAMLQYNSMFDGDGSSYHFFGRYLGAE